MESNLVYSKVSLEVAPARVNKDSIEYKHKSMVLRILEISSESRLSVKSYIYMQEPRGID